MEILKLYCPTQSLQIYVEFSKYSHTVTGRIKYDGTNENKWTIVMYFFMISYIIGLKSTMKKGYCRVKKLIYKNSVLSLFVDAYIVLLSLLLQLWLLKSSL